MHRCFSTIEFVSDVATRFIPNFTETPCGKKQIQMRPLSTLHGRIKMGEAQRRYQKSSKGIATLKRYRKKYGSTVASARMKWRRWALGVLKINMGGCVDCGFNKHPDVLEFHHKPEFHKRKAVARLVGNRWITIFEEIVKCDLLCANCHRLRTATRFKNRSSK